jgi:hypothetical protein
MAGRKIYQRADQCEGGGKCDSDRKSANRRVVPKKFPNW